MIGIFAGLFKGYVIGSDYIVNSNKDFVLRNSKNIAESIYIDGDNKVLVDRRALSIEKMDNLFSSMSGFRFLSLDGIYIWILNNKREVLILDDVFEIKLDQRNSITQYEKSVLDPVFYGDEVISSDFSHFTNQIVTTVGVPVYNLENRINGVLLVQYISRFSDMMLSSGVLLVVLSFLIALAFSYILSIVFSYKFTKPLHKMRDNAIELSRGNYDVRNNICQDDEIGYLANTLDFLSEKLKEADEQTKKLEKMRSDFISNISHELRTPVTVMVGSLEALADDVIRDDSTRKEYYKSMLNEAKFLSRLIKDFLEITCLQNVDFVIEKSKLNVADVMDDVVRSLRQIAVKKNVFINLQKFSFKNEIYGDYGRLRQMFIIVLDNAIKFSKENSQVDIILLDDEVRIKDYGSGIKEEDLPYIFERFYKERSEKNKVGTGLGLSIAKNIAIRHDIELSIESVYGEYAEFIFKY